MTRLLGRMVLATLISVLAVPASASIVTLNATIDTSQVIPVGTGSLGTGTATMTLDDITNLFSWDISWSGLSGPATAMHFHGPAPAGSNAGVQVNIGAISGLTSPSIGAATISGAQASDLLAGLWYINIHTSAYPGGEIRGQVQVVPVPAAVWLFGSGLLGLMGLARKKAT